MIRSPLTLLAAAAMLPATALAQEQQQSASHVPGLASDWERKARLVDARQGDRSQSEGVTMSGAKFSVQVESRSSPAGASEQPAVVSAGSWETKFYAPFQPKTMGTPPRGWTVIADRDRQPTLHRVRLSTGEEVTLQVVSYRLVPEDSFIVEPGYKPDAPIGQHDAATPGRLVERSAAALEEIAAACAEAEAALAAVSKPAQQNTKKQKNPSSRNNSKEQLP